MNQIKQGHFDSIRQILIFGMVLLMLTENNWSQGTDIRESRQSRIFFGVNLMPLQSKIINENAVNASATIITNKNSIAGSFEVGYCLSKFIILSLSAGYSSYNSQFAMSTYSDKYAVVDNENDPYERRVTGSDIKEVEKISFLDVPIVIIFQVPMGENFGVFIQGGIVPAIPLSKTFNSSGVFSYAGYYPAYNVLLQNLPAYGFSSNSQNNVSSNLKLKSMNADMSFSAGFQYYLKQNLQLIIGAYYSKSIMNISAYQDTQAFHLSENLGQMNSLVGSSSKTRLEGIGLRLSLRYYVW
jgi:hypothetical protein